MNLVFNVPLPCTVRRTTDSPRSAGGALPGMMPLGLVLALGLKSGLFELRYLVLSLPGLVLAGNAFTGIGVPDCVRSGMQAADRLSSVFGLGSADATQSTGA